MTSSFRLVILTAAAVCCTAAFAPSFAEDQSVWTKQDAKYKLAVAEKTDYSIENNHVTVKSGGVLLEPQENIAIKTPHAVAHLSRRSLVMVRVKEGCDHIFVLLGSASVQVGRHHARISTGEQAVVTTHDPGFNDLGSDEIGRRRLRMTKAGDGKTLSLCEFSLVHCIEREPMVYSLVHSKAPESKAIKEKLIKMAAALTFVTSRHGPYTTNVH